jgi:hypothetical protein
MIRQFSEQRRGVLSMTCEEWSEYLIFPFEIIALQAQGTSTEDRAWSREHTASTVVGPDTSILPRRRHIIFNMGILMHTSTQLTEIRKYTSSENFLTY